MIDVERVCQRVVFLAAGRVIADGPTADILSSFGHDNLEDMFLHVARSQEGL